MGQALQPAGGRFRRFVCGSVIHARKRIGAPHLKQCFIVLNAITTRLWVDAGRVFCYLPCITNGRVTPLARSKSGRTDLGNCELRLPQDLAVLGNRGFLLRLQNLNVFVELFPNFFCHSFRCFQP